MTDPIQVTLSGNSTPLLPGCGECAALRARLAEAENSLRVSQMLYCGASERCKEAEARAGRAEEIVKLLAEEVKWSRIVFAGDGHATLAERLNRKDARDRTNANPAARAAVEGAK